ncbi:hypothetical protein P8452_08954 [Trifolium repens]|nr:hypothetical protein P8452_08954 [Trifolium repens]
MTTFSTEFISNTFNFTRIHPNRTSWHSKPNNTIIISSIPLLNEGNNNNNNRRRTRTNKEQRQFWVNETRQKNDQEYDYKDANFMKQLNRSCKLAKFFQYQKSPQSYSGYGDFGKAW